MLLWHFVITLNFLHYFGSSGLASLVALRSWCIHCTAPWTFYLQQTKPFTCQSAVLRVLARALRSPMYGLLPTSVSCGSGPHHALPKLAYSQETNPNILERQLVFMCKVISTCISLNSIEYLFKRRRSLGITGIPWRKITNSTCSENCTYFSLSKITSFQQYPAYWSKTTIWSREIKISVPFPLFPEQLSRGVQKGFVVFQRANYHFASLQGSVNRRS